MTIEKLTKAEQELLKRVLDDLELEIGMTGYSANDDSVKQSLIDKLLPLTDAE